MQYLSLLDRIITSWCHAIKSFEDNLQCREFNAVLDWKPVERKEYRSYVIPRVEKQPETRV